MEYQKEFVWKISATSHEKGVVDGVGGNVKQTVRKKSTSKSNDRIVVQDAKSFAYAAKELVAETKIIYISKEDIEEYAKEKPFEKCMAVPGISKIHVIYVDQDTTKLWRNATYYHSAKPDISIGENKESESAVASDVTSLQLGYITSIWL